MRSPDSLYSGNSDTKESGDFFVNGVVDPRGITITGRSSVLDFFVVGRMKQKAHVSEKLRDALIHENISGCYFEATFGIAFV